MTEMTALELADYLENRLVATNDQAADMLRRQYSEIQQWRNVFGFLGTPDELGNEWNALKEVNSRQHEAIKQLREALENARIEYDYHGNPMEDCDRMVMAALKDTEDLV